MPGPNSATPRSVVITGASTGIGAACALELDRREFRVFAGVRKAADGLRLQEQAGRWLAPLMIDVTDGSSVAEAVKTVAAALDGGPLTGLVNNAGIVVGGPLETLPPSEFRRQLEVNVVGQLMVTQAFLPLLRASRGRIVNIGSISGCVGVPYTGAYAASKHALKSMTDTLRIELRRWGISVSIIEPVSVQTPIWGKARSEAERVLDGMTPEAEALYGDDMRAMREASVRLGKEGMPVERVVRAVVHALVAWRPKTHYPIGGLTRLAFFAFRFLPAGVRDWCIRRNLGLE